MDLGDPWMLLSGLFIGLVGLALLVYGKKQSNLRCMAAGAVLCIFPYFVSSLIVLWVVAAACLTALFLLSRVS